MQNIEPGQPDAWAKLIPLGLSSDSQEWALTKDSCTVGKDIINDIQIFDTKVDDVHYRIYKETDDNGDYYEIENLSAPGIAVNDKIINSRDKHRLSHGDKIGFLSPSEMKPEVIQTHIFYLTSKQSEGLKKYQEKDQKKLEENNKSDKLSNHMKCSICLSLIYNCVTVLPCLHNFCASCISDWILQSDVCPNCKQEYKDLRKNPMLNEMINSFLEMNPELKESKGYYDEKDKKDRIKSLFQVVTLSDGAIYEGAWVNGRKEGKGKMKYADGDVYDGDWANNKREGKGKIIQKDGTVYEGDWVNNKAEGKGKLIQSAGTYEGDWVNGQKQGKGKMTFEVGMVYEGDWVDGKIEGKGKMIYSDGRFDEGDWVNNKKAGKGKMVFPNGTVYEGDWADGIIEGKGKMKFVGGDVYEGDWVNNKIQGRGKMLFSKGIIYEGDWVDGKMEGKGKMMYTNGSVYEGDWVNNKKQGKGKAMFPDGSISEGNWVNDEIATSNLAKKFWTLFKSGP